jgi:tetratricopeptide (TPR) repeat protein
MPGERSPEAHGDLLTAVEHARAAGGGRPLVLALKVLGQLERDLGHTEAALACYEEAARVCRSLDDPMLLAHTLRHVGDLYREADQPEPAEASCLEALALHHDHPGAPPLELANTIRPLALLAQAAGRRDDAFWLWREACELYAEANVPQAVAECQRRIASTRPG